MPMAVVGKAFQVLTLVSLLFYAGFRAKAQTAFSCTASSNGSLPIRSEGLAELLQDVVLQCTGGNPTAVGSPVPTVNIQIFMDSNITGRLLAGPWSEALLLIDDPQPAAQLVCGSPSAPEVSPGVCTINGNGTGQSWKHYGCKTPATRQSRAQCPSSWITSVRP
jgi:hypothetical protein